LDTPFCVTNPSSSDSIKFENVQRFNDGIDLYDTTDTPSLKGHGFPSPQEALRWLTGGMVLSWLPTGLKHLGKTLNPTQKAPNKYLQGFKSNLKQDELQVYSYFSSKEASLFRIGMMSPERIPLLLGYATFSALGFVTGNCLDGLKEAWVRWEESCIRASLLSKLQKTVKQGITKNYHTEDMLHRQANERIALLLHQAGISNPELYLPPVSMVTTAPSIHDGTRENTLRTQQHAMIEPIAMDKNPWQVVSHFGSIPSEAPTLTTDTPQMTSSMSRNTLPVSSMVRGAFVVLGMLLGGLTQSTLKRVGSGAFKELHPHPLNPSALQKPLPPAMVSNPVTSEIQHYSHAVPLPPSSKHLALRGIKNIETVSLYDGEAFFLLFLNELKQNRWLVGSFFALGTLTKIMQAMLTGLREIEVTKLNANTEYHYQAYNWQTLNPQFRMIAEQAALDHQLKTLERELPWLLQQTPPKALPQILHQKIARIHDEIGLHSAPAYYMSTPMVNLVDARS
jgi:hypothetical protein